MKPNTAQPEAPDSKAEAEAAPKPEAKAEPKPEAKAEPRPEAKAEPKPEAKAEPKPEAKAEPKPDGKATAKPEAKATPKPGLKPDAKDDLKSLPLAEVEKKLASSPDGLTQAEAQKRLTQYGPNEIEEKKTNELLKFLSYFWGPIPWMIEAAVILSAVARHWPDFGIILLLLRGQRCGRVLGRTPGG